MMQSMWKKDDSPSPLVRPIAGCCPHSLTEKTQQKELTARGSGKDGKSIIGHTEIWVPVRYPNGDVKKTEVESDPNEPSGLPTLLGGHLHLGGG